MNTLFSKHRIRKTAHSAIQPLCAGLVAVAVNLSLLGSAPAASSALTLVVGSYPQVSYETVQSICDFYSPEGCSISQELWEAETNGVTFLSFGFETLDFDDASDRGCAEDCPTCDGFLNPDIFRRRHGTIIMGMPAWWVTEPYLNLWAADEPASYRTSLGQKFPFRLTYKQRDSRPPTSNPTNSAYDAYVPITGWNHNWFSYIRFAGNYTASTGNTDFSGWSARLFWPDGGESDLSAASPVQKDTEYRLLAMDGNNAHVYPRLTQGSPTVSAGGEWLYGRHGFRFVAPDGSQILYGLVTPLYPPLNPAEDGLVWADALMTEFLDPHGNSTHFYYASNVVNGTARFFLSQVVDVDGRTNTLTYDGTMLTRVDMPYGRSAQMAYTSYGGLPLLSSITDAQGLSSSMLYNQASNYLTELITPYGTNSFAHSELPRLMHLTNMPYLALLPDVQWLATNTPNDPQNYILIGSAGGFDMTNRSLLITLPDGSHEYYQYQAQSWREGIDDSYPAAEVPAGTPIGTLDTAGLSERNTWHWTRQQYPHRTSTNAYGYATQKHWLIDSDGETVSLYLSVQREASPDGQQEGQKTWYDYAGKPFTWQLGDDRQLGDLALVLADGATRYGHWQYNDWGLETSHASTYSTPNGSLAVRTNFTSYYQVQGSEACASNGVALSGNATWSYPNVAATTDYQGKAAISLNPLTNRITVFTRTNNGIVYTFTNSLPVRERLDLTNALHEVTTVFFNQRHQVTGTKSAAGLTRTNLYGQDGFLLESSALEIGATNRFLFSNGLLALQTNPVGLVTSYTWDNLQRLTSVAFPDGTCLSNVYTLLDLSGQKDREGHWSYAGYDALRQMTSFTDPRGSNTVLGYCSCGSLDSVTDPLGNTTVYQRDNQGRLTNIVSAACTQSRSLNSLGQVTAMKDSTGQTLTFTYNHQGLPTALTTGGNPLWQRNYDVEDRLLWAVDSYGAGWTNVFDSLGRVTTNSTPKGPIRFGYTARGLAWTADPMDHLTSFGHDAAGRLLTLTNANSETNLWTYNPDGTLASLVDSKGHQTSWTYDLYARVLAEMNHAGTVVATNGYNANGSLIAHWTLGKGLATFARDALGNLTNAVYPDRTLRYGFDALNRLINMEDAAGTTTFTYTNFGAFSGALATEDGPWSDDAVSYGFDSAARLTGLAVGGGWTQSLTYDATNRLRSITSPAGSFSFDYQGVGGRIQKLTLPGNVYIANTFTGAGELQSTELHGLADTLLNAHSYEYNNAGNRTRAIRTDGSYVDYAYDNIQQLLKATGYEPGGSPARKNEAFSYGFDAMGNLQARTNGALTQSFSVNELNELTAVSRSSSITVKGSLNVPVNSLTINGTSAEVYGDLSYATATGVALGNPVTYLTNFAVDKLSSVTSNVLRFVLPASVSLAYDTNENMVLSGTNILDYDAQNQLTNIVYPSLTSGNIEGHSALVYDGLGRLRIRREYGPTGLTNEARYLYSGFTVLQERDGNNTPAVSYTLGKGLLARSDVNGSAYYHTDGNGNVTALVDANGSFKARYLYDPFGNLLAKSGPLADVNTRRFSSKEYHAQSGLYYYGFRWYEPNLQRWVNADPIGLTGGRNRHAFVDNDPLNKADPYGLQEKNFIERLSDWIAETWDDFVGRGDYGRIQAANANVMYGVSQSGWNLIPGAGLYDNLVNTADGVSFDFSGNPISRHEQTMNYVQSSLDMVTVLPGGSVGKVMSTLSKGETLGATTTKCAAKGGIQFGTAGDQFLVNASKATPVNGMLDVAVHGSPLSVDIGADTVNHRVLASLIERNPDFSGQGIRLLSCETGNLPNGFAQNLANKLGVPVQAPNDIIWAFPNGRLTIGATPAANSGSFIQFLPGGGRP
jgi:RHS repeat-associated protein